MIACERMELEVLQGREDLKGEKREQQNPRGALKRNAFMGLRCVRESPQSVELERCEG